jgi:MFS family permease
VSLLVWLTVREPPRGRFDERPPLESASLRSVVGTLWSIPSYRYLCLAAALHVFAGYGASTWHPSFLRRVHGMSGTEVGLWLGPIAMVTSATGNLIWARVAEVMGQRDARWYMWLPMIGSLLAMPFAYALLFLLPAAFLGASYLGATYAMAQALARPNMRATSAATLLLVINLIGMGMGPTIVGFMNDWLTPRFGIGAIRISLLIVGVPHLVAALFNWRAARTLREDLARAEAD